MATNNNATVDIAVYVSMDRNDEDRNVLSFIVQDECHLKKLAIGAYALKILDTKLLQSLGERKCIVVSGGDYVIVHNINEANGINAILFNKNPIKLHKGMCLFKIIESNPISSNTTKLQQHHQHHNKTTGHFNVFTKSDPEKYSTTNAKSKITSPDAIELNDDNAASAFEDRCITAGQVGGSADELADDQRIVAAGAILTKPTTASSSDTETAYSLIEGEDLYEEEEEDEDDDAEEETQIRGHDEPDVSNRGADGIGGGRGGGSGQITDDDDSDPDEPVAKKRKSE
ncbi:tlp-20 [Leucania separata nucleopolyhedrovirus]|uniref:Tlp-20 n=1 Tax=Leucania separata nucleopolyhedrovirus TaxID=1307956 RepID=Q0IL26_NPVLS|nr:tlp-20 [Leucania separata nucleopolyhedrovirus]AAR28857.1 tlp-20 [Leucania separata nucleopolyhedrovirus]